MNILNHRRSIRLQRHDYSQSGAYFVTICTDKMRELFGNLCDDQVEENTLGKIARREWFNGETHRDNMHMDPIFIIMPNHIHGIIWIHPCRGTARRAPTMSEKFGQPVAGSIPTIVRAFKSAVTKQIRIEMDDPTMTIWQRNYHERIIRNNEELSRIRNYIQQNPVRASIRHHLYALRNSIPV